MWCMHRTNLYLTTEQERALDARSRSAGISRSALVRRIIDQELSTLAPLDDASTSALVALADAYHDVVEGLFDEDPDLRVER